MKEKYFDLPFKSRSMESDFNCKDGELDSFEGLSPVFGSESDDAPEENPGSDADAMLPGYTLDYRPSIPDPPEISFSLVESVLKGWQVSVDSYPAMTVATDDTTIEGMGKMAARLLSRFKADARDRNLFTSPFLAIAVWKLESGAFVSPSLPVMLIPNSSRPAVAATAGLENTESEFRITAASGKLFSRISLPESLREWTGKIESLEIMVSRQMRLYDEDNGMVFGKRVTCDSFSLMMDPSTGISTEKAVCMETLSQGWKPAEAPWSVKESTPAGLHTFFTVASIPLEELRPSESFTEVKFNCGTLSECYSAAGYIPSYAMLSFKRAAGAIPFKGRVLAWGPQLEFPDYAALPKSMGNYSEDLQPRWIFHPDPKATEYRYTDNRGRRHKLPLRRHPALYGAFYWRGFSAIQEEDHLAAGAQEERRIESLPTYLWISDKSEMPVFEDARLGDLECGVLKGMCRAFRSSGLVATTVPTLYVFSSEGIYLYKENSSGDFVDAGLVAKYILPDISKLEILPKGVRFSTSSGEVILLTGSSVKVLTTGTGIESSQKSVNITLRATGENMRISTRPLKLSGASVIKYLRKIFLRGNFESADVSVYVYGSLDLRNWTLIGRRNNGCVVFLSRIGCRFFRIVIEGKPVAGAEYDGLSLLEETE